MNDTCRISLLSKSIREQINHRLLNGEPDHVILKWLHTSGEVWALIHQKFQHDAFNSRDLDEWRATAFAEWKLGREFAYAAQKPAQLAASELKTSARQVADHLAEVLAGLYARLMHNWDGEATQEFTARLRALSLLCRDICALRKSEHHAAQLKLAEAKHALRQKQSDAETEAAFLKRLDQPGMRERILHHYNNPPSPEPTAQNPEPKAQSDSIKPNQACSGVEKARPQSESSPAPSQPTPPAPKPQTTDARPKTPSQSSLIKPNQASSEVGGADPDLASSAAPSPRLANQAQSPEPPAQSLVRPNQTKSRDSQVTSKVLPGDPGYVEDDAPDIYSIPNPALFARKRAKEEPIVSGFVSPVSYFASDNRNDVHY